MSNTEIPDETQPDQPTPDQATPDQADEQHPDLTEETDEAEDVGHEGETQS